MIGAPPSLHPHRTLRDSGDRGHLRALAFIIYHALSWQPSYLTPARCRRGSARHESRSSSRARLDAQAVPAGVHRRRPDRGDQCDVAERSRVLRHRLHHHRRPRYSAAHVFASASVGSHLSVVRALCRPGGPGGIVAYDDVRDVMAIFALDATARTSSSIRRWLSVNEQLHVAGFMFVPGIASRYHRNPRRSRPRCSVRAMVPMEPDLAVRVREMRRPHSPVP